MYTKIFSVTTRAYKDWGLRIMIFIVLGEKYFLRYFLYLKFYTLFIRGIRIASFCTIGLYLRLKILSGVWLDRNCKIFKIQFELKIIFSILYIVFLVFGMDYLL